MYSFFVSGIPRPQPRPRMTKTGHVYTPKSIDAWKTAIKSAFLIQQNFKIKCITAPVSIQIIFYFYSGKKMAEPHTQKPDIDNLLKSVMDALTEVGVWKDDAQVYHVTMSKYFTPEKNCVGAIIKISI